MRMSVAGLWLGAALLAVGPALAQDAEAPPNYGVVDFRTSPGPGGYVVNLLSGGAVNTGEEIGPQCPGFVSNSPDVRLLYPIGTGQALTIAVIAANDTTLVVSAPDGVWHCNDDSGGALNPSVTFDHPQAGRYEIWVGTFDGPTNYPAELTISERPAAQ